MSDEDKAILKYSGLMGHPMVGIAGEPGKRRKVCEVSTLDEAKRIGADEPHFVVYSTTGGKRKKWINCYDADQTKAGEEVRAHNEKHPPEPWKGERQKVAAVTQTHTPGPWNVVVPMHPLHGEFTHAINSPTGAIAWAFPPHDDMSRAEANANLIAAAPEMLAALEAAKAVLLKHIPPDDFDGHAARALVMVRDAIAKAKGGAP